MDNLKNVRVYYIHDKNANNHIVGTVCFAQGLDDNKYTWSRGIAICSSKDAFDKKKGRAVALGRCRRAMGTWKSSMPVMEPFKRNGLIRADAVNFRNVANDDYGLDVAFKSQYNVELTPYERRMIEKPEEKTWAN
jgi:hypothetical protein